MPTGSRVRTNNVFGLVTDNPLIAAASTLNSNGLSNLPSISASQHAIITLDPLRVNGAPEIIIVTNHSSLANVATISRGAYGTTARLHPQGTLWTHTPVNEDFIQILTSITRPGNPYNGEIIYETDTKAYKAWESVGSAWEDVLNPIGIWTSFTPTLVQNVTVTKTVSYAKYIKIGRMVTFNVYLVVTGTGTAANALLVGLPVAAAYSASPVNIGVGQVYDTSAGFNYPGIFRINSSNVTGAFVPSAQTAGNGLLGNSQFTAALAVGDEISYSGTYEAIS